MPHYETVIILRQDLSPTQAESIALKTEQNLKKADATIQRAESWGLRPLAYPIRKNRKGHYFLVNHTNESRITEEMQRVLRLNEDLLRILTVKTLQPQTDPSPMAARIQRETETADTPNRADNTKEKTPPETKAATSETKAATPETKAATPDTEETS